MTELFLESYVAARAAFLAAASAVGARLGSAALPGTGAQGETLTIDWALIGPSGAPGTLLSISGVHGAEAHAGSAAQRAFIASLHPDDLAHDCNILLVHGLNPWGFSHRSRVDADNVDLSRNFIDFNRTPPNNPHYERVHAALCTAGWGNDGLERVKQVFGELAEELGAAGALTAFTGGQHCHGDGVSFGGFWPSPSQRIFRRIVESELGQCRRIAYVEWHTGAGAFGRPLVIGLDAPSSPARARRNQWWSGQPGLQCEDEVFESGLTPEWSGLLFHGLTRVAPGVEIAGAPIEIGTVTDFEAIEAGFIDRWLRFGDPGDPELMTAMRARLRAAYDPPDARWRAEVSRIGREMHELALHGLRRWVAE
jgi:hypothetical protein